MHACTWPRLRTCTRVTTDTCTCNARCRTRLAARGDPLTFQRMDGCHSKVTPDCARSKAICGKMCEHMAACCPQREILERVRQAAGVSAECGALISKG